MAENREQKEKVPTNAEVRDVLRNELNKYLIEDANQMLNEQNIKIELKPGMVMNAPVGNMDHVRFESISTQMGIEIDVAVILRRSVSLLIVRDEIEEQLFMLGKPIRYVTCKGNWYLYLATKQFLGSSVRQGPAVEAIDKFISLPKPKFNKTASHK